MNTKDTIKKAAQGDLAASARIDPLIAALVTSLVAVLVNFGPIFGLEVHADRALDLGLAIGAVVTSARAIQLAWKK